MEPGQADGTDFRRALEALRSGVPNRHVVRALGGGHRDVEKAFQGRLSSVASDRAKGKQTEGLLISGGFGSGKSHILEYLQHVALSENFMCSRVVISKETPLHDPRKVYLAAIEGAQLPEVTGPALPELALRLRVNSPEYAAFFAWCNRDGATSPLFPATLLLHERLRNDPELVEELVGFWSGQPIAVKRVRDGLKGIGQASSYTIKSVPQRALSLQRFSFVTGLAVAAGYAGWVLLIDELELIGRYTLLQRGRSYAELARWLGAIESEQIPGLLAVGAITDDFGLAVLEGKGDKSQIEFRLRAKETIELAIVAARAGTGMRMIERKSLPLEPPDDETLRRTYERLRDIHGLGYKWTPPDLGQTGRDTSRPMRSYVRRWINEWDLMRIYPGIVVDTEEANMRPGYFEDEDLDVTDVGRDEEDP